MDCVSEFGQMLIVPANRGFLLCRINKDYFAGLQQLFYGKVTGS